jgi:hypothetical protein
LLTPTYESLVDAGNEPDVTERLLPPSSPRSIGATVDAVRVEPDLSAPWGLRRTVVVVAAVTMVGLLVALAFMRTDEATRVSKLKGGECLVTPQATYVKVVRTRPCTEPHTAEVYARFGYPGITVPGSLTPAENCRRAPDGMTPDQAAIVERVLAATEPQGSIGQLVITNNENPERDRDYACLVTFPERTGSYLSEAVAPVTTTIP